MQITGQQVKAASEMFDRFSEREDWLGYGYLGNRSELGSRTTETREYPGKPAVMRRVDRAAAKAAASLGWTEEQLFLWSNSKCGRWFAEGSGSFRNDSNATQDFEDAVESMRDLENYYMSDEPTAWAEAKEA